MTVVATAGHVDHGKSSLVRALTGTDPDRLAEERRRGLTIDLGFAHTTLPSGARLSFVDVPGHERFVHNMLAGVGAVAGCVFVVDAREGWRRQSEEHLRILELLGVGAGVVALTKTDLVDAEALSAAELDVAEHVAGTFLADAPVVAVSVVSGDGIERLVAALGDLVARAGPPPDRHRARMWVDRVFEARGTGTVVTGTLTDGALGVGDAVVVEPGGRPARVRAIQTAGRPVGAVAPGARVALNLAGVGVGDLGRGSAVVHPGRWRPTDRIDATLQVLAGLGHDVSRRGAYSLHVGAGDRPVTLRVIGSGGIAPGSSGLVRLFLADAVPLLPGDRYVLRESGRGETVGGGEVLDIDPVLPVARARPDRSVTRVVRERGWVTVADVELLTGERVAATVGDWVTTTGEVERVASDLRRRVGLAGANGVDAATLDDRERAVLATLDDLTSTAGRVTEAAATDPFAGHPVLDVLRAGGFSPPGVDAVPRGELRELVRRGLLVERDGVHLHAAVIDDAAALAAQLLAASPDGFTVSQFRQAADTTRKFAVPLVAELDARGITRRRGDLHVAGPRLPAR